MDAIHFLDIFWYAHFQLGIITANNMGKANVSHNCSAEGKWCLVTCAVKSAPYFWRLFLRTSTELLGRKSQRNYFQDWIGISPTSIRLRFVLNCFLFLQRIAVTKVWRNPTGNWALYMKLWMQNASQDLRYSVTPTSPTHPGRISYTLGAVADLGNRGALKSRAIRHKPGLQLVWCWELLRL